MATIYHLPNPRITGISEEEALTLVRRSRANRKIVKQKSIQRAIAGKARQKKAPNKVELLASLSPAQAKELLLLMGESIEG